MDHADKGSNWILVCMRAVSKSFSLKRNVLKVVP